MSNDQLFDGSNVKKGSLITVKFENGKKRSGIVTSVISNQIMYRYFDESVELIQAASITRDEVENGEVAFVVAPHLTRSTTAEGKTEAKTKNKPSFFESLKTIHNVDQLIRVFKNEDANTLALIASYLNGKKQLEFLYRLPDDLYVSVGEALKNMKDINADILSKIEVQLEEKFNRYKEEKKAKPNEKASSSEPNFDPLGGLLGGLLGGKGPEELFKNFNPNDIKGIFGEAMKPDNQSPLPNADQMKELLDNMPKMINDIFGGLLNQKDDDDDDFPRKPKF